VSGSSPETREPGGEPLGPDASIDDILARVKHLSAETGSAETGPAEPIEPALSSPSSAGEAAALPVVEWMPSAPETSGPGTAVKLWRPRDVTVVALLLGFPAGLGLAARNWIRLGHRRKAYLHLAAGAAAVLAIGLLSSTGDPSGLGTGLASGLYIGVPVYLFWQTRASLNEAAMAGRVVERGGVASGLATAVGAWLLLLAPVVVAGFALSFAGLAPGGVPRGTVAFGTGGSGCEASGVAAAFSSDQPLHVVVAFERQVRPGEVVKELVSEATAGSLGSNDLPVDTAADCYYYDLPAGALQPGAYTVEYDVGTERLARGQLTVTGPGSS
jgi:hypothetical protein